MRRLKSIMLATLAVLMIVGYIPAETTNAQSAGSASLSIAPRKDYIMDPGETINDTLSIRNIDSANDLSLNLRVIDFTYTDDSGTPKLLLDKSQEPTTWSLDPYLTIPEFVTIKANSSESVDISVTIPENLGAGSYYSAIIYSTGAPDGGNVGLSASGVTLVFVTVPGEVNEELKIQKFNAYDPDHINGDGYQWLMGDEPKYMGYTLENLGNVVEAPVGSITLRNMFGKEYIISDINPNRSLALIGQTRTFQSCINPEGSEESNSSGQCVSAGLWPGFYQASISVFYGQNGNQTHEINKTAIFWYLPLWFLVTVLILALLIAFAIWRLVVAVQRKTKRPKGRKSSRMMRR